MREKLKTLPLVQLREMAKAQGLKGISTLKKAEIIDRLCELEKPAEGGQKEETPRLLSVSIRLDRRNRQRVRKCTCSRAELMQGRTHRRRHIRSRGDLPTENGLREGRIPAMSAAAKADTAGMNTAPIHAVRIIMPVIRITADASTHSERGIREIPMCRVTITMKR